MDIVVSTGFDESITFGFIVGFESVFDFGESELIVGAQDFEIQRTFTTSLSTANAEFGIHFHDRFLLVNV